MKEFERDLCDNSIAYTNEECTNYRLERAEIVKINGMDAYQIKHSMTDSLGDFTEIVTDFKSPDYGVTIFASANTDEFYNHENDFNAAINSFELENPFMMEDQFSTQELEETSQKQDSSQQQGGCLIATATYGSELSTQVQQLRELRDNYLLQTESGSAFMIGFNELYYSFSPTIADLERESTIFKEAVKLVITPMISSLSLLNYVELDSEAEVLGYGISLILLNVGMYLVSPAVLIHVIRRKVI